MVGDTGAVSSTYDPGLYTTTSDDAMLIHKQMYLIQLMINVALH